MFLLQQGLQTRYDGVCFRFHISVKFHIFWHTHYYMWSMSLGHLPIIYIIIYQLFKSLTDGDVIYNPMLADYSKTLLNECHQKMDPNDVNIEQCGWNQIENWCPDHTHTIYCGTGLHFTIAVGSTLKNGAECIYICTNSPNYQIWLV